MRREPVFTGQKKPSPALRERAFFLPWKKKFRPWGRSTVTARHPAGYPVSVA